MPSKRRLRHASSSNAPQVLLNNAKSANLSGSLSGPATPLSSGILTLSTNHTNNHRIPKSNSSPNNVMSTFDSPSECGGLTEKQLRNAYLATLTKDQLKIECRKRGQKITGNRTELLQRLGVKMSQLQKQDSSEASNLQKVQKHSPKSSSSSQNGSTAAAPLMKKQSPNNKNKEREREDREKIVLWRRPLQTVKYCLFECSELTQTYGRKLVENRSILVGFLVLISILGVFYKIPGHHQLVIDMIRSNTWFVVYWVGLGVLSSVGLGTGLHTFLLYLGPHIASVTLAAYECNSLNFPKPPYPDDIICPEPSELKFPPNLWNIMSKVRIEAFLWGAGTALGELPPYFMARAARLSGYDPEDAEDLEEFEKLQKRAETGDLNMLDKAKIFMERVVERVGFFGILACASIPNPLFDLAGITCGHFLVPFWTFFGATLIGKAVIKMHIQKIFVIIAFNESLIERAVDLLGVVPLIGRRLQEPFKSFLQNQKNRLHRERSMPTMESSNVLAKLFEKFVIAMVCYFVVSIVNSLAQSYHKRIHKKDAKLPKKLCKDD